MVSKSRNTDNLITERINPRTIDIDTYSTLQIVGLIAKEDELIVRSVYKVKGEISGAVDLIVDRLKKGGRLFFVGAGTSGRLGVMEAAECPPTFGTDPGQIQGIIAGGKKALWRSIEGAEDSKRDAGEQLIKKRLRKDDVVVGIAASADTPFVRSALSYAKKRQSTCILITCNPVNTHIADITIPILLGPEVIVGSTRMKAGTATKMVLNILTTASMVRLGKTYGNLMVDLMPASAKLRDRAKRIIMHILGVDRQKATSLFNKSKRNVKIAIVMGKKNLDYKSAKALLEKNNGFLREAIK